MKSKIYILIVGIIIGAGSIILFNKLDKKVLETLPTQFYSVLFENDNIRIIDHNLNPGEIEAMHNHPQMYVYFIESADVTRIDAEGNRTLRNFKKGENFLANAQDHSIENSGEKPLHTILVEIK